MGVRNRSTITSTVAVLAAAGIALAGCGSEGGDEEPAAQVAEPSLRPEQPPATKPPGADRTSPRDSKANRADAVDRERPEAGRSRPQLEGRDQATPRDTIENPEPGSLAEGLREWRRLRRQAGGGEAGDARVRERLEELEERFREAVEAGEPHGSGDDRRDDRGRDG